VWLKFRPLIYTQHPYRWPTIGAGIQHIEEAVLEDVKAFFAKYYVPANAILVLAGRVTFAEAKALAEKWFGPIPGGSKPKRQLPQEPVQTEDRRMEIVDKVPSNRIYKAYPVPGRYDEGFYAIDLMSDLMGRNETSFLYLALVQNKRIFDSISVSQTGSLDPGLLIVSGQVCDGVDLELAEKELNQAIHDFVNCSFQTIDLERVKNQAEASLIFGEVEVLNRAMNLAMAANAGDVNLVNLESENLAKVTLSEVNYWAKKIFKEGKSNTLIYKKA
jgi:predicted Zn-dependent peptidase